MKRILALDGGGIRGVFSLMVLARIEQLFRDEQKSERLVLRDVFDFFVGTSTGAIIATFLAWGFSVDEVLRLYTDHSHEMFAKAKFLDRISRNQYEAESITRFFQTHFQEDDGALARLGTRKLYAGDKVKYLMVVMRNATTGSPWSVTNNPMAKYSVPTHPECNLQIPVWQLLRASTAAPTYFPPEEILLGNQPRIFVDGGLTPYNNPALIAVLTATLPQYNLIWETGTEKLHLVSVGTGSDQAELPDKAVRELHKLDFARYIAPALIASGSAEQDALCRILGDCLAGEILNREIYFLRGPGPDLLSPNEKKFTYVRYNTRLKPPPDATDALISPSAFNLDNLELIPFLVEKGRAFAASAVKREHLFPPFQRDLAPEPKSKFL